MAYTKKSEISGGRDWKICVALTQHTPICAILCNAHATAKINILTWNTAYSIFPLPTFIHGKSYLLKPIRMDSEYGEWAFPSGMKIQDALWDEERTRNHPIREQRRIGDRFTWTIDLPTRGITCRSKVPDSVLQHCHFMLRKIMDLDFAKPNTDNDRDDGRSGGYDDEGDDEGGDKGDDSSNGVSDDSADYDARDDYIGWPYESTGIGWYELRCQPLEAQVLKYQYTHGSLYMSQRHSPSKKVRDEDNSSWRHLVVQRTNRLTLLELQKMGLDDRPKKFAEVFRKYVRVVKRPERQVDDMLPAIKKSEEWVYIDEDIPKWYRAWEKEI